MKENTLKNKIMKCLKRDTETSFYVLMGRLSHEFSIFNISMVRKVVVELETDKNKLK